MGNPTDMPLSVTLAMDEATRQQLRQSESIVEVAEAYVIDSPEMAQSAKLELDSVKARYRKIEELRKGFIAPARQIIDNAQALFNPALRALEHAEVILKSRLSGWTVEQQRIADEARRKAQEEERRRQQEAESQAAAARARAEEQAAQKRREAEEAEARRKQAEAEGNTRAAAAAAAEAAKKEEQAKAAIENGEAKATEVQLAAAAAPTAVTVPEPTKVSGFQLRDNWIAELAGDEDAAKVAICTAIGNGRIELLSLLALDMKAANKLAKALKGNFNVPGLKARNAPIAASR